MGLFEPSTWAEVEEAVVSNKPSAQPSNPFVVNVRSFTNAPERYLTSSSTLSTTNKRNDNNNNSSSLSTSNIIDNQTDQLSQERQNIYNNTRRRPPLKRSDAQFDDLLGQGRVDLDAEQFVRRYATPTPTFFINNTEDTNNNLTTFPVTPSSKNEQVLKRMSSNLNPSSVNFNPVIYLCKLHKDSSITQLESGCELLKLIARKLDERVDCLRRDCFIRGAVVESALRCCKLSVAGDGGEDRLKLLRVADGVVKEKYGDVVEREIKIERLKKGLVVYGNLKWIFVLGHRLKDVGQGVLNGDIEGLDEVIKQHKKAALWLQAQRMDDEKNEDGKRKNHVQSLQMIERNVQCGFQILFNALLTRLSSEIKRKHQRNTARIINILITSHHEDIITQSLTKRTSYAHDLIDKACKSIEDDVTVLTERCSGAFIKGMKHILELVSILTSIYISNKDKWLKIINDNHLSPTITTYNNIIRKHINVLGKDSVIEIGKAFKHLRGFLTGSSSISSSNSEGAVGMMDEVYNEVCGCYVKTICNKIENEQLKLVATSIVDGCILDDCVNDLDRIVLEGLGNANSILIDKVIISETIRRNIEIVNTACMKSITVFIEELDKRISTTSKEVNHLKLVKLCDNIEERIIQKHFTRTKKTWTKRIRQIRKVSFYKYMKIGCKDICKICKSLGIWASMSENNIIINDTSLPPIRVTNGISRTACEICVESNLLITTAKKIIGDNKILLKQVLLAMVDQIAQSMILGLSSRKLGYRKAAQLWVDVTVIVNVLTSGCTGLEGKQVKGFLKVRERAVQAILTDGFVFSPLDEHTLKQSVVKDAMNDLNIICSCFTDVWRFLQ